MQNVPSIDQRSFTTLVDENYQEVLGRAPAGTEPAFAAVSACSQGFRNTQQRLSLAMEEHMNSGGGPKIRFLKDSYKYFVIGLDGKREERWSKVYTVLTASQVPSYIRLFKEGAELLEKWLKQMDRRLIGQDGKSRAEMVDAFQSSQGRILPSELNTQSPIQQVQNQAVPKSNGKRPIFSPLKMK